MPVSGAVAGLGAAAVKTSADFDSAMSQVAAVFGATGADFDALRDKAREMGWIIPYKQSIKEQARQRKFEEQLEIKRWKKAHVDDQIRLLYGPISQLLGEQNVIRHLVALQFGRDTIFNAGKDKLSDLEEKEQKIWVHFVITYVLPYQQRILSILRNNQHLMEGDEWPDCYKAYMEYTLAWEYLQNQKDNEIPNYYEYKSIFNYPVEFNYYISSTTSKLLEMQKELETIEIDS